MKLAELEPQFIRRTEEGNHRFVDTLGEAQGVMFLCPKCFAANAGNVGTHYVLAWFRDHGVPDDEVPGPGRWTPSGTGVVDLSLTPSVHLPGEGCGWHGFVTNGSIVNA